MDQIGGLFSNMRKRKTKNVICGSCKKEYSKRVDTLKNWNLMCRLCTSKQESKIKGVRRAFYSKCKLCGKESRWIGSSGKCKVHISQYDILKEKRSPIYIKFRRDVLKRDNWKCRIADVNCGGRLEVHHILPWRDFVELRYIINNGITLCHAHHPRKREEEAKLSPYFQKLVAEMK